MCSGWCNNWVTWQHARCNNGNKKKILVVSLYWLAAARGHVSWLGQFLLWGVAITSPNTQDGRPPFVGCPQLLMQYIRCYNPYLEAVSPSATWGRAMQWWQGPLRIGTGGGLLWLREWNFGFHKMRRISWPAEDLLASQEGVCSVERVSIEGRNNTDW